MVKSLTVLFTFLSLSLFAQDFERNGNETTYKGNKFRMDKHGGWDTVILIDPVTDSEVRKIIEIPRPISMNGKKIYDADEVTTLPQNYLINSSLEEYILNNLKANENLKALPDGDLNLKLYDVVIDENGKVVFYDYGGLWFKDKKDKIVQQLGRDSIIDALLTSAPPLKPGMLNGKKVTARLKTTMNSYDVEINNYTITYSRKNIVSGK